MNQMFQSLAEQMRISDQEIERRKFLLDLTDADIDRLRACKQWIEPFIKSIVKDFYKHQTGIPEIAAIIGDAETLSKLSTSMLRYVLQLFSGNYDIDYVNSRLRIGKVHQRIGVSPKLYLSAVSQLQQHIEKIILEQNSPDAETTIWALRKLFYFDNQLVLDTYIAALKSEVEQANSQLEEYVNNLEQIVAERTADLTRLSMQDPLTGLFNQRAFYDELEKSIALAKRTSGHLTLLYIDLNFFKEVNDTYGHKAGDSVLISFAKAFSDVARKSETAARYGGDEFCIVLPDTKIESAINLCQRLSARFDELVEYPVTMSIGGASLRPECTLSTEELISQADQQMYLAKAEAHRLGTHSYKLKM